MSGIAKSSAAFAAFTLPPYKHLHIPGTCRRESLPQKCMDRLRLCR